MGGNSNQESYRIGEGVGELSQDTSKLNDFQAIVKESEVSLKEHIEETAGVHTHFIIQTLLARLAGTKPHAPQKENSTTQVIVVSDSSISIKKEADRNEEVMADELAGNGHPDEPKPLARQSRKRKHENESEVEIQHWKSQLAIMEKKYVEEKSKSKNFQNEIRGLEQKITKLRGQVTKYKALLTKSDGDAFEEVKNSKIVQDYASLRDQIQRIVDKHFRLDPAFEPQLPERGPKMFEDFYRLYKNKNINAEGLRKRFRGLIFKYLHKNIFTKPLFGLDSADNFSISLALLESKCRDSKKGNARIDFVVQLSDCVIIGQISEIIEWRIKTMKCISMLEETDIHSYNFANSAFHFLLPFITSHHDDAGLERLMDLLVGLFEDAHNFALLLRRSKHSYKVEIQHPNSPFDKSEAVIHQVETHLRNGSQQRELVGYLIFGALAKFPEDNPNHRILLEKAYLVSRIS
ncbi:hypothetical protein HYALB_00004929 [Hymenoscyphus albidus]|uniref:Uncharacterized protein n=1 Tax=Hymenoscyphus albidus TaxID=595503 RepID=A0A9N9LE37_9HELO|nr:hypothetical protein HYALB_00004929 [Hymenoscyphus albidus]